MNGYLAIRNSRCGDNDSCTRSLLDLDDNQLKKSGIPLDDERTNKIKGKAYQAGFLIGAYYLTALNIYNIINIEFMKGEQLESMPVINSALIIMGISVLVLKTYWEKKEDI